MLHVTFKTKGIECHCLDKPVNELEQAAPVFPLEGLVVLCERCEQPSR